MPNWEIKDWNRMQPEVAKFILDQSEKKLIETVETAERHTQRALNVLTVCLPATLIVASYILETDERSSMYGMAIIVLTTLVVIAWLSIKVYRIYEIHTVGNNPKKLIREDDNVADDELQFVVETIESIERRITFNVEKNRERGRYMLWVFNCLIIGSGAIIAYAIFLQLLRYYHP